MSLTVELKHEGKKLEERLQPTLEAAEREATNAQKIASTADKKVTAVKIMHAVCSLCVFAIIVSSIYRTGELSNSATLAMIAVNVFVAAPLLFYDYRLHKSGEPKRSMRRMVALSMFIVDVGTFIIEDRGRMAAGPEMEAAVAECEWRFGQIMGATSGATLRLEDEVEAEDRWARWKVDHRLCGGRVGEVDSGTRRDDAADPSKSS